MGASVSGKVIANRTVDYEEVHWLNFTVRASDNGSPPRAAEIPVYLEIVDINDNNPIFDQPSYQVGGQTNMGIRTCASSLGSLVWFPNAERRSNTLPWGLTASVNSWAGHRLQGDPAFSLLHLVPNPCPLPTLPIYPALSRRPFLRM